MSLPGIYNAQVYLDFSTGYGFPLGGKTFYERYDSGHESATTNKVQSYRQKNISYGTGASQEITIGLKHNDLISTEIGLNYTSANQRIENVTGNYTDDMGWTTVQSVSDINTKLHTRMFSVNPGIRFETKMGGSQFFLKMAARVSLLTSLHRKYFVSSRDTYSSGNVYSWVYYNDRYYSGGMAIGGSIALGWTIPVSPKFGFRFQVFANALNWSPKKVKLTRYEVNGNDPTIDKEDDLLTTFYVNEFTENEITGQGAGWVPNNDIKEAYPFSTYGFNIGLHFNLGTSNKR